jgi:hypothetical protein
MDTNGSVHRNVEGFDAVESSSATTPAGLSSRLRQGRRNGDEGGTSVGTRYRNNPAPARATDVARSLRRILYCEAITIPAPLNCCTSLGEVSFYKYAPGRDLNFDACRRSTRIFGRHCGQCSRAVRLPGDYRESCRRLAHVVLPERVAYGELLPGRLPGSHSCHGVICNFSLVSPHDIVPALSYRDVLFSRRFAAHPSAHSLKPI